MTTRLIAHLIDDDTGETESYFLADVTHHEGTPFYPVDDDFVAGRVVGVTPVQAVAFELRFRGRRGASLLSAQWRGPLYQTGPDGDYPLEDLQVLLLEEVGDEFFDRHLTPIEGDGPP